MTKNKAPPHAQTSMFDAFEQAEFEKNTAHMPATIGDAGTFLLDLIRRYNSAVLAGDQALKDRLLSEADDLAYRLNGGDRGIKIHGGVCDQLETLTAAPEGEVPLWGQTGNFVLTIRGCRIRIEFDGIYGLCEFGFSAHAVDWDKPFISQTGYFSFLVGHRIGVTGGGLPVEGAVRSAIEQRLDKEQRGKLVEIEQRYRDKADDQAEEGPEP